MLQPAWQISMEWIGPRWLLGAVALVLALIGVQYALKMRHSEHGMRSAFLRWKPQLEELDSGVNIWRKHAYPNPPIMAILLKPFMALPPTAGASLWFACKALMALAAIAGVLGLLENREIPFPFWGKLLAIVLALRPIEGDLMHGNVNLLILFLIVAAALAYCRKRDVLAGACLGLGVACKLTPALFLPYLVYQRAWKTLAAATGAAAVFLFLVPAVVYGWSNNLDYLQSWHEQMIAPFMDGKVTSEHKNQSLPGLLHRMLSEKASFSDYEGERKIVLQTHNLVAWDSSAVQAIVIGVAAVLAALALASCRTVMADRPRLAVLAEWSVVVLGMLLFCERTWKHHCVTLLLPFAVLAYGVSSRRFNARTRWSLAACLAVAGLLMFSTSTGVFDSDIETHDRIGKLAQVYGAYAWAFLILLAGVFMLLREIRKTSALRDATCQPTQQPGPS